MKKIIIIICLFSISLNAQKTTQQKQSKKTQQSNIKEQESETEKLYFGINLNNEFKQIIHYENHIFYNFVIKAKFEGKKKFISNYYKINKMTFFIKGLNKKKYCIKNIEFPDNGFYEIKENKKVPINEYRIKIFVEKTDSKKSCKNHKDFFIKENYNIQILPSGIIDIEIIGLIEQNERTRYEEEIKNLGSHICKSRVTYN